MVHVKSILLAATFAATSAGTIHAQNWRLMPRRELRATIHDRLERARERREIIVDRREMRARRTADMQVARRRMMIDQRRDFLRDGARYRLDRRDLARIRREFALERRDVMRDRFARPFRIRW